MKKGLKMRKMTNCPNCAAPLKEDSCRCEYCGTHFFDFCGVNFEEMKPLYLRIKLRLGTAIIRAIPRFGEVEMSADAFPKINIEFICQPMDNSGTTVKWEEDDE